MRSVRKSEPTAIEVAGYDILHLLGEGGMAQVFLARRLADRRQVVLKIIHPHLMEDPRVRAAFRWEVQSLRRFRHPYAVALLDASAPDSLRPWLALEHVDGRTLEEVVSTRGRMHFDEVGRILGMVCSALFAAHHAGILHRDLTLANIMSAEEPGRESIVKVMDFGLSRPGDGLFLSLDQLNGNGSSLGVGTPDYLCPEMLRGESVDHRGDLYCLGVVLYGLLSGRLPFADQKTVEDMIKAHQHLDPPTFRMRGIGDVPPAVEAVVRLCLAKNPADRPADARQLALLYGKAIGRPIAGPADFEVAAHTPVEEERPGVVLHRVEAWMPEAIAIMKLRAFAEAVGGIVEDSLPGLIEFRVPDPESVPEPVRTGWLSIFRRGPETPSSWLRFELRFRSTSADRKNQVTIELAATSTTRSAVERRRDFFDRLGRELRAYLLVAG